MKEAVYCDDCPARWICAPETGHDCTYARYIQKIVDEAPPLTEEQISLVVRILSTAIPRVEAPPKRRDSNRHRQAGPFLCQVRGCPAAPLKHRGTLWQHVRGVHNITLAEYREQYGDPVPLTAEELENLVVEARCDVEGCDQVYSTALGNRFPHQALISHMWGRHAIKLR